MDEHGFVKLIENMTRRSIYIHEGAIVAVSGIGISHMGRETSQVHLAAGHCFTVDGDPASVMSAIRKAREGGGE